MYSFAFRFILLLEIVKKWLKKGNAFLFIVVMIVERKFASFVEDDVNLVHPFDDRSTHGCQTKWAMTYTIVKHSGGYTTAIIDGLFGILRSILPLRVSVFVLSS